MTRPTALKSLIAGFMGLSALGLSGQPSAVLPQGTIEIDGTVEESWDLVEDFFLEEDLLGTSPDPSDFSAYWKGYWDTDNLYLLFVVEDSTPTAYDPIELDMGNLSTFELPVSFLEYIVANLDRITSNFWEYDVIQVFVDPDLSAGETFDGVDDTHFIVPRDDSPIEFTADPLDLASVSTAFASTGEGLFVLEMAIPMADLGLTAEVGSQFGMDVVASDRTDIEAVDLTHLLGWGPAGNMATPADLLVVELGEAPVTDEFPEQGEVPDALLDDSVIVSVAEDVITYESDWFGVYTIEAGVLNTNVVFTNALGTVQFTSLSTATNANFYSFLTGDIFFTNSTYWPLGFVYSLTRNAWLFLIPENDINNGGIWAWNYSTEEWELFEL